MKNFFQRLLALRIPDEPTSPDSPTPNVDNQAHPINIQTPPESDAAYLRHLTRAKTLLSAIEKSSRLGQQDRIESLKAEFTRRANACAARMRELPADPKALDAIIKEMTE